MSNGSPGEIVVVGGGIAGQRLCEALRDRDPDVSITLVCGESRLPGPGTGQRSSVRL